MNGFDRQFLLGVAQAVMERQPHQPVADIFGYGAIPGLAAKGSSHLGEVQGQIVEDSVNTEVTQILDEFLAQVKVRQQQIEHVIRLLGVGRDDGQLHTVLICPIFLRQFVRVPERFTMGLDPFALFQLPVKERCQQVRRQVG